MILRAVILFLNLVVLSLFTFFAASKFDSTKYLPSSLDATKTQLKSALSDDIFIVKDPFNATGIRAKSYILLEANTGSVFAYSNMTKKSSFGSIAKLLTVQIAIDSIKDKSVKLALPQVDLTDSQINAPGHKFSALDLIKASMIISANDGALSLTEYVTTQSGKSFVTISRSYLQRLGLKYTSYSNPVGYDDQEQFSNAYDLAWLGYYSLKYDLIRNSANTEKITITSDRGFTYTGYNTNKLLGQMGVDGLKTGTTDGAGPCFIFTFTHKGGHFVGVVLDSEDRFYDASKLVSWTKENIL